MTDRPAIRRCLDCNYSLEHLAAPRCPECGREFNPMDPSTFAVRRPLTRGWFIATVVVWLYTIGLLVAPYIAWLIAWATLGHRPQLSGDWPGNISIFLDLLQFLYAISIIAFPVAVALGIIANIWLTRAHLLSFTRAGGLHLGFVLMWVGSIALSRFDPWQIGVWCFD